MSTISTKRTRVDVLAAGQTLLLRKNCIQTIRVMDGSIKRAHIKNKSVVGLAWEKSESNKLRTWLVSLMNDDT